jgi:hypothetical protein
MGYHKTEIEPGVYGELSKVREEFEEAVDAWAQNNPVMLLQELSDVLGAIEAVASKYNVTLADLVEMAAATKRAFADGTRVPRPARGYEYGLGYVDTCVVSSQLRPEDVHAAQEYEAIREKEYTERLYADQDALRDAEELKRAAGSKLAQLFKLITPTPVDPLGEYSAGFGACGQPADTQLTPQQAEDVAAGRSIDVAAEMTRILQEELTKAEVENVQGAYKRFKQDALKQEAGDGQHDVAMWVAGGLAKSAALLDKERMREEDKRRIVAALYGIVPAKPEAEKQVEVKPETSYNKFVSEQNGFVTMDVLGGLRGVTKRPVAGGPR